MSVKFYIDNPSPYVLELHIMGSMRRERARALIYPQVDVWGDESKQKVEDRRSYRELCLDMALTFAESEAALARKLEREECARADEFEKGLRSTQSNSCDHTLDFKGQCVKCGEITPPMRVEEILKWQS
jgi:hypothetical protein